MDKLETAQRLNRIFKNKIFDTNVRLINAEEQGDPVEFSFNVDKVKDMISFGEWTPTCIVSVNIVDASKRFKLVFNILGDNFINSVYIAKVDLERAIFEIIEPFFDGNVFVKISDQPNAIKIDL